VVALLLSELLHTNEQQGNTFNFNNNALENAAKNGHLNVVSLLLRQRGLFDRVDVILALNGGHIDTVKFLLSGTFVADLLHADEYVSLRLAAQNGHRTIVELLVRCSANQQRRVSHDDDGALRKAVHEALREAAKNGHRSTFECIYLLIFARGWLSTGLAYLYYRYI
jgi:ankyrin repeat protein